MTFKEVPFETPIPEGMTHCAFVALTAFVKLYEHYPDATMPKERREAFYPVTVMQARWDGHLGFVGGKLDAADKGDARRAVVREAAEEINFPVDYESLAHVVTHATDTVRLDFFQIDLGTLTMGQVRWILVDSADADQTICEGTSIIAHLCDYGADRGWNNLHNSNMLSSMVKEELEKIRARMWQVAPEGTIFTYETA